MTPYNNATIQKWMIDLGLKGNDLIAYAIIFQCSQNQMGHYCGGAEYLSKFLNISEKDATDTLKRLVDGGYILNDTLFSDEESAYIFNKSRLL